jgi:hypothetical protein
MITKNGVDDLGAIQADIATLVTEQEILLDHVHHEAKCYPTLAAGVELTAGSPAWALGTKIQIIPATTGVTSPFDVHYINVESMDADGTYEIVLWSGASGATEVGRVRVTRTSSQLKCDAVPIHMPIQAAGTRIMASVACSTAGKKAIISVLYHTY